MAELHMCRWMGGWCVDGWTCNGWVEGERGGWMGGWIDDACMVGRFWGGYRWAKGKMDRWVRVRSPNLPRGGALNPFESPARRMPFCPKGTYKRGTLCPR